MKYRCAVDVGAARTMVALLDEHTPEIVASERLDTGVFFFHRRPPGQALADSVQLFLIQQQVALEQVIGVGVGIPGLVDRASGTVLSCPNLPELDHCALAQQASARLGIPTFVDNNTNLIALGEHTAGLGRGVNDMAAVFVGSGVGCGLILGGHLYEGADGLAGELGHTIVVPKGLECSCGQRGCLEMYCSGKALTRMAEAIFGPREMYALGTRFEGARLLIQRAAEGDARAQEALHAAFTYLGIGLLNMVNLLNPHLIVLGGGIVMGWPEGARVVSEAVMQEARPGVVEKLRIEVSELQNLAGVSGGAALVTAGLAGGAATPLD